ncbi:MAG: CGGC domain-containing protein, partial [PVC group bacterium]|nr:CGGC domain-containing protein [PVC group bacterium]MCP4650539.1 CGGC domain-containing protein [PVC group bacterium]
MKKIKYIVVVQCHIVKERCSGYLCEYAFSKRTGSFSKYPK